MLRNSSIKKVISGFFLLLIPLLAPSLVAAQIITQEHDIIEEEEAIRLADSVYTISNYEVYLEIYDLDVLARVSITYNVTSGTKYEGYKRFRPPGYFPLGNAPSIQESSIRVYDDTGSQLNWDYSEFEGRDNKYYIEIKFYHTEFTGVKTITMSFLMKNWIIETFSCSQLFLNNFGKFSIPVSRAEYTINFPASYDAGTVRTSAPGQTSFEQEGDYWVYTLVQTDSISSSLAFDITPNLTKTVPWVSIYIILLVLIGVSFIGIVVIVKVILHIRNSRLTLEEWKEKEQAKDERRRSLGYFSGCGGCGGGGGGGGGCGGCGG
ncbi:MAG: hypothetical protein JW891_04610 [Candidatus Lokiarchaeota archaeon]|nr:hypothetical protein [Candidatus Lokiarchaeota archaeon]